MSETVTVSQTPASDPTVYRIKAKDPFMLNTFPTADAALTALIQNARITAAALGDLTRSIEHRLAIDSLGTFIRGQYEHWLHLIAAGDGLIDATDGVEEWFSPQGIRDEERSTGTD